MFSNDCRSLVCMLFSLSIAYRIIFLNNVDEDCRISYDTPVKYWNADKPSYIINGSKAIVTVRLNL